jgi:hypothetical protein
MGGLSTMVKSVKRNVTILGSMIVVVCLLVPSVGAGLTVKDSSVVVSAQLPSKPADAGQNWAVIFAVGIYAGAPDDFNRPEMIDSANNLYDSLMSSGNWQADHIQMLQTSQATGKNLIRSLLWLKQNAKAEDHVLVYITTHGSQLKSRGMPLDLPPKDEADGMDEFLMMYNGYENLYAIVWDDLLNFFLSLVKCQGLCLIVDSCYSGGFNDAPMKAGEAQLAAKAYQDDFAASMAAQNRVVLMSCSENEVSYGSFFSQFLIDGFNGAADLTGNQDGINSAEEAFSYSSGWTQFWLWLEGISQTPTMVDGYPGEFPVTFS